MLMSLVYSILIYFLLHSKNILAYRIDPQSCVSRPIHEVYGSHGYYFSWEDPKVSLLELSWAESREFCRLRCMELVSLETRKENEFINQRISKGKRKYVWTSGRKCNFSGCDRPDLKPISIYGWFWSGSLVKMPPTTNRIDSDWSDTGALGRPQPDNREQIQGGPEEECMAILNNFYDDGLKWHDIACSHRKPFICEDSDDLLSNIQNINPAVFLDSAFSSIKKKSGMDQPEAPFSNSS